ncbi:MAG: hypothetical protein JSC188_000435 [Candidatus Tokpelaia sp. JSC188]|nr:MAG: hypothetical protein JSC188_000435 [Candidatus Tokpelaia sp. JSC188]
MRAKKLAKMGNIAAALKHCYRERETPNADQTKTPENEHYAAKNTNEALGKMRSLLPKKRRKDAVLAIEYIMTTSPEWWESASQNQQTLWRDQSINWLEQKYGKDRIVTMTMHKDEKTPHLSAFVIPLTKDGRLSAKEFIGGREKMKNDQSTYAHCLQELGLERGIQGSKAKHQSVKQFYAQVEKAGHTPTIQPKELKPQILEKRMLGLVRIEETQTDIANRLNTKIAKAVQPIAAKAAVSRQEHRRAEQTQKTAHILQERLKIAQKNILTLINGLDHNEIKQLLIKANELREEKQINAEKQRRIDRLPYLTEKTVGVVKIFATKALNAIKKVSGKWQNVEWETVEHETKIEAIKKRGLTHYETAETIMTCSPGQADKSPEFVQIFLDALAEKLPDDAKKAKHEAMQKTKNQNRDQDFER